MAKTKSSGTETKKAAPKKAAASSAATGIKAPVTPSAQLAKVVGSTPQPRTEIIKKIWEYIKKHDLQDKENKRMINADETLKVVFDGKKQISMFELAKVVSKHVN